uniref:Lysosome-associated membrane glycoprotein 5 n=1 Tax=Angiostrongylus cantonensis TaxID=6313 RepID=A0A0K0DCN8_ANGCA
MKSLSYILFLGLANNAIFSTSSPSSPASYKGSWQFPLQPTSHPCIVLNAQIKLYLTYTDNTGKEVDALVDVLPSSTVDEDRSSCGTEMTIKNETIFSQILHINIDHYPGWNIRFAFSSDKRLIDDGWMLYQVNATADYPATRSLFPNPPDTLYNYFQPINLEKPPKLLNTVSAHLNKSFYCTSAQRFWINSDTKQGTLASFKISYLQVESFKKTVAKSSNIFDPSEVCPFDQRLTDLMPVVVGSCLAGLNVIALVTYLVCLCLLKSCN